ncbi:DgyrCDS8461 [Dimorphilus gyrociliatus]|uniref:DgyrCDS8461 n=1 Tax=Dimorphilus gyrociliatus TaxID=2664684 RepID=A0A7I8VWF2_9ANNE|nr:DgyrCDS8461 [Dimorphilus gyrociliatus]
MSGILCVTLYTLAEDIDVKRADATQRRFDATPNSESTVSEGLGGKAVSIDPEEKKTTVKNVEIIEPCSPEDDPSLNIEKKESVSTEIEETLQTSINAVPSDPQIPNPNIQSSPVDQAILTEDIQTEIISEQVVTVDTDTGKEEIESAKGPETDSQTDKSVDKETGSSIDKESTSKSPNKETDEISIANAEETAKSSQEELPSFEEWRQKELEAEKNKGPIIHSTPSNTNLPPSESNVANTNNQNGILNNNGANSGKRKTNGVNYASSRCGAKILNSNTDSSNVHAILTENKDSYMNSPCSAKKFFTVELCESIAVRAIKLGSYELFSSLPKTFSVKVSERWPTKEWKSLGIFHARELRDVQLFNIVLPPSSIETFTKYIRIDMMEHFGKEHYCPVSVLRVYGITDDYDDSDTIEPDQVENNQEDDNANVVPPNEKSPTLFKTAKDTVIGLMHKMLSKEEEGGKDGFNTKNSANSNETMENNSTSLNSNGTFSGPCAPNATSNGTNEDNKVINKTTNCPEIPIAISKSATHGFFLDNLKNICWNCENPVHLDSSFQCSYFPSVFLCRYFEIFIGLSVCCVSSVPDLSSTEILLKTDSSTLSAIENSPTASIVVEPSLSQTTSSLELTVTSSEIESSTISSSLEEEKSSSVDMSTETKELFSSKQEQVLSTQSSENLEIEATQSTFSSNEEVYTSTLGPDTAQIRPTSVVSNPPIEKSVDDDISSTLSSSELDKPIESTLENSVVLEENTTMSVEELEKNATEQHIYADESKDKPEKTVDETETEEGTVKLPYDKKLAAVNRLRSKIKELELDLHLTSRYLEELSQRYRKKMEETHQMLNSKIINMTKAFTAREQKQREQIERSHREIVALKFVVRNATMLLEKAHLRIDRQWHFHFFEVMICFIVWFLFKGKAQSTHSSARIRSTSSTCSIESNTNRRRNSIDSTPRKKEFSLPEKRTKDDLDVLHYKNNFGFPEKKSSNIEKMNKNEHKGKNKKKKKKLMFLDKQNSMTNNHHCNIAPMREI